MTDDGSKTPTPPIDGGSKTSAPPIIVSTSQSSGDSNKSKFHSALAISNIKNPIPLVLDVSNTKYNSRAELFKLVACAHRVFDHIDPKVSHLSNIDDDL